MGGLYAVSTDICQPILAEPMGPEHPSQVWEVHHNENNKYIITQPGFNSKLPGIGPVLMGWSLSSPSADHQGGRILFGVGYVELEIEPVGSSDNYFSIRVPDPNVTHAPDQVEFFIAECDHDLVSCPYWSSPQLGVHSRSAWLVFFLQASSVIFLEYECLLYNSQVTLQIKFDAIESQAFYPLAAVHRRSHRKREQMPCNVILLPFEPG